MICASVHHYEIDERESKSQKGDISESKEDTCKSTFLSSCMYKIPECAAGCWLAAR